MENNTEIFSSETDPLLAQYSKGIGTATIIMFTLSGLNLLISGFGLIMIQLYKLNHDSISAVYSFGIPGLIFLVLGLASKWKPLIPILLSASLAVFELACALAGLVWVKSLLQAVVYGVILIVIIIGTIFLFRGAIFARKKMKLLKQG